MKKVEIQIFEPGDIVLYQTGENGLKSNIGMVLKRKDNGNYVLLSIYNNTYKDIQPTWIVSINDAESVRMDIIAFYESKIFELQAKIRKPTQEEKDQERVSKYEMLKEQIIITSKNLIDSKDNADFENKLKAIADLKKKIFSIELECASDIRKENGRIKRDIKNLIIEKDSCLKRINDDSINKAFDF